MRRRGGKIVSEAEQQDRFHYLLRTEELNRTHTYNNTHRSYSQRLDPLCRGSVSLIHTPFCSSRRKCTPVTQQYTNTQVHSEVVVVFFFDMLCSICALKIQTSRCTLPKNKTSFHIEPSDQQQQQHYSILMYD